MILSAITYGRIAVLAVIIAKLKHYHISITMGTWFEYVSFFFGLKIYLKYCDILTKVRITFPFLNKFFRKFKNQSIKKYDVRVIELH